MERSGLGQGEESVEMVTHRLIKTDSKPTIGKNEGQVWSNVRERTLRE